MAAQSSPSVTSPPSPFLIPFQTPLLPSVTSRLNHHTELRHLPPWVCSKLGQLLDDKSDHWRAVMAAVPATPPWQPGTPLPPAGHNYPCKYTAQDIRVLDNALASGGAGRADGGLALLLTEWSCSGRQRPLVADLLALFDRLTLGAAAAFIRRHVLGESSTDDETQVFKNLDNFVEVKPVFEDSKSIQFIASAPSESSYSVKAAPDVTSHGDTTSGADASELDDLLAQQSLASTVPMVAEETPDSVDSSLASDMQVLAGLANEAANISKTEIGRKRAPIEFDSSVSLVPHLSYDLLYKITNGFSDIPYSRGGRKLGQGAFGVVYKAQLLIDLLTVDNVNRNRFSQRSLQSASDDTILGEPENQHVIKEVAVKKLTFSDDRIDKQFKTEVEILSQCNHKNILSLEGYSCDGAHWCLLYAFMIHGSLQDRLACVGETEVLSWTQRLRIAIGTADGLAYLHTAMEKPMVHRDVKSANILLDVNFIPKVGDFGLVRMGGSGTPTRTIVKTTTVFGTSAYMAPEAFRGDVSAKMDTFSYGIVLLELLTGLSPYDEEREGRDLLSHVMEAECPPEQLCDAKASPCPLHLPQTLLDLGTLCTEDKRKRPTMVQVTESWKELTRRIPLWL